MNTKKSKVKVKKPAKVKAKVKAKAQQPDPAANLQATRNQIERNSLIRDAEMVLSLVITLILGHATKVTSIAPRIGDEPLLYLTYLKKPLMDLFAGFEHDILKMRRK